MARAPLLQLSDVALTFGGEALFADVDTIVQPGDRVALVGRNASGKSTLMRVMAGLVEPDSGARTLAPGTRVGYMEQHPDLAGFATLGAFAASDLEPGEAWRVEMAAEGLKLDPATPVATASGGERRRAALVKLMAEAPELMLLDEPTNHLDIEAITWLEETLAAARSAFVLVSHDRAFLRRLTRATLWVDRGTVRRHEAGFASFEGWRDKVWADEDAARAKLDRRIRAEAHWAAEGISARRRRNQGRLRNLDALRAERRRMADRQGAADMALESGSKSGKRVIEARAVSNAFDGEPVVADFSIRVERGERIALVGANGVGKTTLLKLLTGELAPDAGEVRLGTGLELAVFDQARTALDPDMTLWDTLTGDRAMRVRGESDQVMVRGQPRHVVGYLRDFLFDERQAKGPVRALSGGERARLLLAKLMARQSNILVLDEPTNDLDVETLDLLQELLDDYAGTVLLVSHDRDFMDRVATRTVAMEGGGRAVVYAGGWTDYRTQRGDNPDPPAGRAGAKRQDAAPKPARPDQDDERVGLSFTEKHRLDALPDEIERLEAEIARLEALLSDADLYTREPAKFAKATEALTHRQSRLAEAESEWMRLEEKAG